MPFFKYKNKNIYYEEIGNGAPVLLLHGNTASSKMFDSLIDLYKDDYKLILIDFLGHGKSDRIDEFPTDFWFDEAMQAIELLRTNQYGKVNVIGTSGGALVALNIALEQGELVNKVIADSFEGEEALSLVADTIFDDRQQSKEEQWSIDFYRHNHGSDWEVVVDCDTDVMIRHYKTIKKFFHKDLDQLKVPVLLTASLKDEFAELIDFNEVYQGMASKMANGKVHLLQTGGHPAMLSGANEFFDVAKAFFADNTDMRRIEDERK